jgi:hypothetical protein
LATIPTVPSSESFELHDVSHLGFEETRLPFLKELDADKQHAIDQQDYTHSNANHPESIILSESWLARL